MRRLIYHLEKCGQMVVMLRPPVVLDSKFLFCNNLYKYIHIGRFICVGICTHTHTHTHGFPDGSVGRESVLPAMQETQEAQVRSPGQEDPLEEGMETHYQYSCLENPMDRGAWRATVHRDSESDMTEATEHVHTHTYTYIATYFFGEGNGTPLQYSCLENPMDRGAW